MSDLYAPGRLYGRSLTKIAPTNFLHTSRSLKSLTKVADIPIPQLATDLHCCVVLSCELFFFSVSLPYFLAFFLFDSSKDLSVCHLSHRIRNFYIPELCSLSFIRTL